MDEQQIHKQIAFFENNLNEKSRQLEQLRLQNKKLMAEIVKLKKNLEINIQGSARLYKLVHRQNTVCDLMSDEINTLRRQLKG